jgi:tetratricopeptide (TPR) repeat protein
LAREVAIREGLKAVIAGDVISVGLGYVVSARLVAAESGEVLWTDSETARDSTAIIDAIDALSRRLRERVGESLRTIRPTKALSRVTTSSLEALKKYSQGRRAQRQEGDYAKAIAFLQEATQLDTLFASAYRTLGVTYYNMRARRHRWADAFTTAFELSDRLPDRERYEVEGIYYWLVTEELDKAVTAYRALLEIDPHSGGFNLAAIYMTLRDYARAEPVFRRSLELDSLSSTAYNNLAIAQVALGKLDEARLTLQRFGEMLPDHPSYRQRAADFAAMQGDYDEAETQVRAWRERFKEHPPTRANSAWQLAILAMLRGQLAEADLHLAEVGRVRESQGLPRGLIANSTVQGRMDLWFRADTAAALRRVEATLDRYPLDSMSLTDRPYGYLIRFYARAGQPELARAYLREWEERAEHKGRSFQQARHYFLGHIAISEGRPRDAIREYRQADRLELCPICALGVLAFAYDQAGERDSALAVYERYVTTPWLSQRAGDSWWLATAYGRLGDLYEQRGDTTSAIRYYAMLVDLWRDADSELQPRVDAARRAMEALITDR